MTRLHWFMLSGLALMFVVSLVYLAKSVREVPRKPATWVASVQKLTGEASRQFAGSLDLNSLSQGDQISHLDILQTESDGDLTLVFKGGLILRLKPNTRVTVEESVENSQRKVNLIFQTGEYEVMKAGPPGQFFVTQGRQYLDLSGGNLETENTSAQTAAATPLRGARQPPPVIPVAKEKSDHSRLSNEAIVNVIVGQKNLLNRCYTHYLTRNPEGKGRIDISFIVQPNGNVGETQILRSNLQDRQIEDCVKEVFSRARFAQFEGDPLTISYPIEFR